MGSFADDDDDDETMSEDSMCPTQSSVFGQDWRSSNQLLDLEIKLSSVSYSCTTTQILGIKLNWLITGIYLLYF